MTPLQKMYLSAVKQAALEVHEALIRMSPVKTGRLVSQTVVATSESALVPDAGVYPDPRLPRDVAEEMARDRSVGVPLALSYVVGTRTPYVGAVEARHHMFDAAMLDAEVRLPHVNLLKNAEI